MKKIILAIFISSLLFQYSFAEENSADGTSNVINTEDESAEIRQQGELLQESDSDEIENITEIITESDELDEPSSENSAHEEINPAVYEMAWKTLFPFSPAAVKDPSPQDNRSFSEISQAEYWFIKESMSVAQDDDFRKSILLSAESWLNAFKDSEHADDVLLIKAELLIGIGDQRRALITLMKHRQTYPDSLLKEVVKEKLSQITVKLFKKKQDSIYALAEAEGEGRISRLARLYSGLAEQFGDELFEPLVSEFQNLIASAPTYAYRDRLMFSLAQLYYSKGYYEEAYVLYSGIIRIYPESSIIPLSKISLADINAREKRNYAEAINIYKEIAVRYEGMEEAFLAYKELPRLLERQKQYEEAVNVYEKIIRLYPDKPEARDAYRAESSILRYELKRYADAITVIKRMAEKYKDNRAKNDLYSAVEIAKNNLKNLDEELSIYDIIIADYPDAKNAPAALLAAAQACDKAKQTEKAKEYYQKILDAWPSSSQAKKAEKALNGVK